MFPFSTDDNQRESEIVANASGDDMKQQQEELKRKIELEAEERKLEETLEYQRRLENEAKQKHLAEQCKMTGEILLEDVRDGSHTDPKLVGYSDPLEQFIKCNQNCFFSDGPPRSRKGTDLGASSSLQAQSVTVNQNNELDQFRKDSGSHDVQMNSEVERPLGKHERPCQIDTNEDWNDGLNDLTGVHAKTEGTTHPGKSSTGASMQRIKRSSGNSYSKFKQGIIHCKVLIGFKLCRKFGRLYFNQAFSGLSIIIICMVPAQLFQKLGLTGSKVASIVFLLLQAYQFGEFRKMECLLRRGQEGMLIFRVMLNCLTEILKPCHLKKNAMKFCMHKLIQWVWIICMVDRVSRLFISAHALILL